MPIQVLMPALSPTMEKGNLAKWVKAVGDRIRSGDVLAEIETDKATMEVEATDEGTLGKILVPEGTADVAVNTPIAVILSDGEDTKSLNGPTPAAMPSKPPPYPPPQAGEGNLIYPPPQTGEGRVGAGPLNATLTKVAQAFAASPQPVATLETNVPADTEMVTMTVREALRDAMAEEMRRDADVFVLGEEVAEYQGAY